MLCSPVLAVGFALVSAVAYASPLGSPRGVDGLRRNVVAHKTFRNLVVFGDSYSDSGNAYHFSNDTWPADPAYYKGRFSNGPVWVEYIAEKFGLGLHNYAFGGATSDNTLVQGYTGPNATIASPSATDQVAQFLASHNGKANVADALYVILIGANDAFFDPNVTGAQTVENVSSIMKKLGKKGAKQFLVASYPDLSRIPQQTYVPPSTSQQLHEYSEELRTSLHALGDNVAYVDMYQLFNDIFSDPARYGYDKAKITKSCLTGVYGEAPRSLCNDPDKYIWWDEYHPTTKSHKLMAGAAENVIHSHF